MKLLLISVGKKHDPRFAAAIDDYTSRLNRFAEVQWHLIPAQNSLSHEAALGAEAQRILQFIKPSTTVVLLDEYGSTMTTPKLAQRLESFMNDATKDVAWVIGSAYGVDKRVKQRADLVWSLSPLVFPHQMVRLILVEQLYRAYTILNNHPYHHT